VATLAARRGGAGTSTRAARAGFCGWIAALTTVYYSVPDSHVFTWSTIGLSGAGAILLGVRLNRPSRRLPWLLLALALIVFTTGDTVYNTLLAESPSTRAPVVVDVLYLLVYLLLAAGFVLFVRARSGVGNRAALLDALVPTVALGLLAWVYWIAPYTRAGDQTLLQKAMSVGYPLGDVLLAAMTLRLLILPGRRPFAVTALAAATAGLLASDVIYGQAQLNSDWSIGGPIDLGWILFYGAMGFSALHPSMRRLTEPATAAGEETGSRRLVFMAIAALIAPVVLFLKYARDGAGDALVIAVAAATMFLLVLVRVGDLLGAQRLAAARERALRQASAKLVSAATADDVVQALRAAITMLMPAGRAHHLTIVDADEPDQTVALVGAAGLPDAVRADGFDLVLRAGLPRLGAAYLAAPAGSLRALLPSFEALFATAGVVIERIRLTGEINRRDSDAYFRTLIQSASDVILIIDEDDRIRYASPSAETVFGRPDVVGEPLSGLIADTHADALREVLSQVRTGPGHLDGMVCAALSESGAPPGWPLLEITESLVLHDAEQVWADLRTLRALGVRVAIDDFGTGYSSLSYLRQMPVDVLKIDKSFVDDIVASRQQHALVNAIVMLARELDLAVVAEGIEEPEQLALLARMGCPYGQGYLFAKPIWPAEIEEWITAPVAVG